MKSYTMLKSAISHHLMGVGRTNLFRSGLKLRLGLVLLMGAGLFVACSRDEKDPNGGETPVIPDVPVVFSSGLSDWTASRAANGNWEEGDRLGIYMIPHVAETSASANLSSAYTGAANVPYLTSGGGESVALAVVSGQKAIVFPVDDSPVNFVAYSPYQAETNTTNGHVYKVDVSTQSPAKAIDLLYHKGTATAYNKNNKNVKLGFTHQLSKIKISLVPASGTEVDLSAATLTLTGFPTTADFNLSTGVLSNLGGTTKPITPVKDAASFEAIIVPHEGDSYTRNVTFKVNGTDYSYPLPALGAFKAGVVHSYEFEFTGKKIVPVLKTDKNQDGYTVSWGDYRLTVNKTELLDLPGEPTPDNTITISTNTPFAPIVTLSGDAYADTEDKPDWMTGVLMSDPVPGENGSTGYTLTFDTNYNMTGNPRTGYIRLGIDGIEGLALAIRVTQKSVTLYVNDPEPPSFLNMAVAGETGKTFTLTTNFQDEDIAVVTPSWITNLTKERGEVADDGSSTWTIGFDVTPNTTIGSRSGNIEVTIGGRKKTIPVSQVAMYVANPVPATIPNVVAAGTTGKTFTLTTNAPDNEITVTTTNTTLITNLSKKRATADNGSSTWTIGFDVTENTTTSTRTGNIEVIIGGQKKLFSVSQVAMYVANPVPATIPNVVAAGTTGKTFTLTTNSTAIVPTSLEPSDPSMITNLSPVRSVQDAENGIYLWTVTFDVSANTKTASRSATISINIGGITKTVSVPQVAMSLYVNTPVPPSFVDLAVVGKTDNTFTIATNAPDENISVSTTNTTLITNLTKTRGEVADDGSYTWTIGFDVTGNTTTSKRSGYIEVIIGGQKKTVQVSQVAMYVNAPNPTKIENVNADGETGKTFTIETNSTAIVPTSLTTDKPSMITNLDAEPSVKDAANGIYLWTVTFDVLASTTTSNRSASISINIGGITKTISVSQVAMSVYVNNPSTASFSDLAVGGATDNRFTIETNAPDANITVNCPTWITYTKSRGTVAADGTSTWTVVFDVSANKTPSVRTGDIEVTIGGIKKTVSVSQVAMYVNAPNPANIPNVNAAGETGKTFTIETNSTATVLTSLTATDDLMITNLNPERSLQDVTNGIYLWTVTFDVSANTTTSARSASISINIGGVTKTISVSQVAMPVYVNDPIPASFEDLAVGGETGKTFTITTNTSDEEITMNCPTWITIQTKTRTMNDDGSFTWTIGFDVSANTVTYARAGGIGVIIGGVIKTVYIYQVALYVGNLDPALPDVSAAGETGKTFTIETNSTVQAALTTTDNLMIMNLNAERSIEGVADGVYVWTVTFDVSANTTPNLRMGSIEIAIGSITKNVSVSQFSPWRPPVNTNDDLANCYMVAPGNSVTIPITRAITIGGLPASANPKTETLWDDNSVISGSPTLSGSGASGTITVRASSNEGNAVVALKDAAGTIYWSWHIWVTDDPTVNTWTNPNNTNYTFMDRNLGAIEAALSLAGRGLFYQWGRKDPFPGGKRGTAGYAALNKFRGLIYDGSTYYEYVTSTKSDDEGISGGILEAIREPTTFFRYRNYTYFNWLPKNEDRLWNTTSSEKTVYDPCPHGWRVPKNGNGSESPWYRVNAYEYATGETGGIMLQPNSTWPHAGYRDPAYYGGELEDGTLGYWWSHTLYDYKSAYSMSSISAPINGVGEHNSLSRFTGASVRCVKE